jgi:hypothetical protein
VWYIAGKFTPQEVINMAVKTKIPLEKIMALKKRLHNLPPKDTGKTREEAMEMLAEVFQSALRKGYSLQELRGITTEEGVTLALSKITGKKPHELKAPVQEPGGGGVQRGSQNEEQRPEEHKNHVQQITAGVRKNIVNADAKPAHGITIKPDTPDEEL